MEKERYPGERRGLTLFLEEIAPVVEARLGSRSLLHHAILRALRDSALGRLRHARQLFNALPRSERQRLSAGLVAAAVRKPALLEDRRTRRGAREVLLEDNSTRASQAFVCFDIEGERAHGSNARISLRDELLEGPTIRAMIKPGTLPSHAARALRDIATLLESDRRLLSERYWRGRRLSDSDSAEIG